MITKMEVKSNGSIFSRYSEDNQYFTRMYAKYFGTTPCAPFEDEKDIVLVEIDFELVNITELMNDGRLDLITFDDYSGDMSELYLNFIEDNDDFDFWKEFVNTSGYAGNVIYIHRIEEKNGGNNFHIRQAIEDLMRRFSHNEGITAWCKGHKESWDLDHEEKLHDLLKQMDFRTNLLDTNWLFIENDRKMEYIEDMELELKEN